jgi:hypothetical protein
LNDIASLMGSMKAEEAPAEPKPEAAPTKPQWILESEKKTGIEYEWKPDLKAWRPKAGMR